MENGGGKQIKPGEESFFGDAPQMPSFFIPKPLGPKEFEVVGIPLKKAGLYVVELESPKLSGAAGAAKADVHSVGCIGDKPFRSLQVGA
ncbi:MAG: hypothetical protein IPP36_11345 [Nitrosomonadales bacterium]|nr:hypothetical protein [Nitrosomonadales bacterium]